MDFQEHLSRAGKLTQDIGDLILRASDENDLEQLPKLIEELKEVVNVLNMILHIDRILRAQNN